MRTHFFLIVVLAYFSVSAALSAPAPVTCVTSGCHSAMSQYPFSHGPVVAKGCAICHHPGDSEGLKLPKDHPSIKPIFPKDINASCLVCHDEFGEKLGKLKHVHKVITEKTCTSCHDAHGSSHKSLLKEKAAPTLCLSCHDKFKKELAAATVHHSATTDEESCLTCHDPHASERKNLLKGSERELCLKCHSKEIKMKTGETLPNFQKYLDLNPVHHKPIREGSCSGCHNSHGSQERRLLKSGYKTQFYQDVSEGPRGLCFDCHKSQMTTKAQVTDETKFRNGSTNLHHLHRLGEKKNRSCAVCHSVHASKQPKLIADWVDFYGVQLPLHFQKTASGGNCTTACHGAKKYDRLKGVKNAPGR